MTSISQAHQTTTILGCRLLKVDLSSAHPLPYNMSRSSEQDPLLPSSYSQEEDQYQTESPTWRERVSEALESSFVHKLVIALVRYSFLSCIEFFLLTLSLVDRHRCWMCSRRSCLHPFIL